MNDQNREISELRAALSEVEDEMADFARYCRSVAEDAMGLNRLTWAERAEWAERIAALASRETDQPKETL